MSVSQTLPTINAANALFLDFDGTLSPIQDDPDAVQLPSNGAETLRDLSTVLGGALAVISGRDVRDLSARMPSQLWRAGGHGLEVCRPGEQPAAVPPPAPAGLEEALNTLVAPLPGVRLESKGSVFAIHFREAVVPPPQLASALDDLALAHDGYSLQQGKMVFELKPNEAHKGRALARFLQFPPFQARQPVMVGDDTTDEDAMAQAIAAGGWAIKVGAGESCATHRLNAPEDVWSWLMGISA